MSVLTVDSLTGCNSIPSFLGGSGDTPANPSIMIFHQTSAPTNWTKVTTWNDTGLRVIGAPNGTPITTGGTLPFTQTFTSRSAGPFTSGSQNLIGTQISASSISYTGTTGDGGGPHTVTSVTITEATSPPHSHTFARYQTNQNVTTNVSTQSPASTASQVNGTSGAAGPGQSHTHTIQAPHSHPVSGSGSHSHNSSPGAQGNHNHSYSGSYDFSVSYVDIIVATKN